MGERKKILHIITGLDVGGAEINLSRLLPELQKEYENVVCCLTIQGPVSKILKEQGIKVYYLEATKTILDFLKPSVIWRFYRLVKEIRPDRAITYLIHADLFGRFWGKLFGIPQVLCWHRGSLLQWQWLRTFDRLSSFLVNTYIFQTEAARIENERLLCLPRQKTAVIPNSVFIPDGGSGDRYATLLSLGVAHPQDTTLICVSNLRKGKGHPILFRAFEKLFTNSHGRVNLLIVGDGEQRPFLETLRAQMNAKERIYLVGHQNNVPALLTSSDIFVLPTFYEGMSNAILEAMALSCAVISTDIEVNREILVNDQSGILVPVKDAQALAIALGDLVQHPEKRLFLSNNAKIFIQSQCSPDVVAKKISDIILSHT